MSDSPAASLTLPLQARPIVFETATSTVQPASKERIEFLDGIRGTAILAVILFHAFVRWPALYVYGDKFNGNPLLNTGKAGVNLFFIVSGFVILMTLRKCKSFPDFMSRRWFRLFPAMLFCSVLILLTSTLFPERPMGAIQSWDLLPGLTFIGDGDSLDGFWGALTAVVGAQPIKSIEGVFWSLYVEVKFYIVFGLAYFLIGEVLSVGLIVSLFVLGMVAASGKLIDIHLGSWGVGQHIFAAVHGPLSPVDWLTDFFRFKLYGFFATGALFFIAYDTRSRKLFWLAAAMALLSAVWIKEWRGANIAMTLLFIFAMSSRQVRALLASRVLVFVGFISYPLYLLHENMMVAMIVKIGHAFPAMPAIVIPVLPMSIVAGLAWVIAKYMEPAMKSLLRSRVMGVRNP